MTLTQFDWCPDKGEEFGHTETLWEGDVRGARRVLGHRHALPQPRKDWAAGAGLPASRPVSQPLSAVLCDPSVVPCSDVPQK